MADVQRFQFEEDGEAYEIFIETRSAADIPVRSIDDDDPGGMGIVDDISIKMQKARNMIRGYTLYALSAFKDMGIVDIEEVSLKFGLKIGGKTGIPYITEGSADCNLEISVKCKLPAKPKSTTT
ncbi:MAG: hypothetical protein HC866_05140 [Leptolyngbyaceae cyanobacterium RU_5_1]|nr:hypothetical protein [Leptolyngbyaceae cyanobacterium RU_5_1]